MFRSFPAQTTPWFYQWCKCQGLLSFELTIATLSGSAGTGPWEQNSNNSVRMRWRQKCHTSSGKHCPSSSGQCSQSCQQQALSSTKGSKSKAFASPVTKHSRQKHKEPQGKGSRCCRDLPTFRVTQRFKVHPSICLVTPCAVASLVWCLSGKLHRCKRGTQQS